MPALRTVPVADLVPAPYNPRVPLAPGSPAYRRLERSLDEFDLVQPLVWNERTGHVVGGHQRLEILKRKGVTEIDAVVVDLPLEREKALNVALNNSLLASDWDADRLVDVLAELDEIPEFDATLTGFDLAELNDMLLIPSAGFEPEVATGIDAQPESDHVEAVLVVPRDAWEDVRPDLDDLIAYHGLTVHVRE